MTTEEHNRTLESWMAAPTAGHETHGQSMVYCDDTGQDIALVYDGDAHADLIAAAPELLAACKALVQQIDNGSSLTGSEVQVENARTAIAKAQGSE